MNNRFESGSKQAPYIMVGHLICRSLSPPLFSFTPFAISLERDISKENPFVLWWLWKCLMGGELLTVNFYLLTLDFFVTGPAAESQGLGFIRTQSCCQKLPLDGGPVESVPLGPGKTWSWPSSDLWCECFHWKPSKLFVSSQELSSQEVSESASPACSFARVGSSDKSALRWEVNWLFFDVLELFSMLMLIVIFLESFLQTDLTWNSYCFF